MVDFRDYRSPFDDLVGTTVVEASGDRVVATVDVSAELHQPNGIVHGGLYSTVVETTASIGANLWLDGEAVALGVANHTDFLRSVREGRLTADAQPVQRGRSLQLWRVEVRDAQGALVAYGNVRLMNLRG
ncbi:MAG: PaaI family thioesterase [Egibacteraceae bacterium]